MRRVRGPAARATLLLALTLVVASCDFRPIYAAPAAIGEGSLAQALAGVRVTAPRDRLGQILKAELEDALAPGGVSAPVTHRLDVILRRAREPLAIQLDSTITRYDLTLTATAELAPLDGETPPAARAFRVERVASYNQRGEPFATLVAEEDAGRRAAKEVAIELRTLLALHFAERAEP